jgi:hypothetical protein
MKNKKLTYFLIFIVLIVWGLIIYRVFVSVGGDDDLVPVATVKIIKEPYNDYSLPKDTTKLLLNYRDPFGLVKFKDTVAIVAKTRTKTIQPKPISPFNWGFIHYAGYIRNSSSKKLIALVSINGKNEMLSEGDTKDRVKLIKNLRDSIKISFNGRTKFIVLKSAAL